MGLNSHHIGVAIQILDYFFLLALLQLLFLWAHHFQSLFKHTQMLLYKVLVNLQHNIGILLGAFHIINQIRSGMTEINDLEKDFKRLIVGDEFERKLSMFLGEVDVPQELDKHLQCL